MPPTRRRWDSPLGAEDYHGAITAENVLISGCTAKILCPGTVMFNHR
jgi:hypothetical protein